MQKTAARAAVLFLLAGLSGCSGGGGSATSPQTAPVTSVNGAQRSTSSGVTQRAVFSTTSTPASTGVVIAIDAGGGATGNWAADTDYTGGWPATVSNSINTGNVSNPAPQSVYQSQRTGTSFSYRLPNLSASATYSVTLEFVESFWPSAGQRLFNVSINGAEVLSNFDIFASAGGENVAIAKTFSTTADSSGHITIQLTATRDSATLAGIEVLGSSSSSPATAAPTATPAPAATPASSGGDALPWVYSELWSGSSPFRTRVSQLKSSGASTVPHSSMDSLWNEGIAGWGTAAGIPIYVAKTSDPLLTTTCTMYGGGCNARNVRIHVPSYAKAQHVSDAHITVIDQNAPSGPIEIDCWQASVQGSNFRCSWAGVYSLGGEGLDNGGSGIHGGMGVTTVYVTAQELLNGHIDHALGMNTQCLNSPNVYPADTGTGTDQSCDGSSNPPHYGNLMHLLWSSSQIQNSAYSAPCKAVLTALATYGAYLDDTGNGGLQVDTQNELSYTANPATASEDPWPRIQSQLNAAGDGAYSSWSSCLQRLNSSDFELLQLAG